MELLFAEPLTVKKLYHPAYIEKNVEVSVLRLDAIHPVISGNKWFKLKNYLADALVQNKKTIATFGGAYSNHIIATAAACKMHGLQSIGIIRGERPAKLSHTLLQAMAYGMRLLFISRHEYRQKILPAEIKDNDDIYLINEGGYGKKGAAGIADMFSQINNSVYSTICCCIGTGTTMAGLIKSAELHQKVIGISVLKNNYETTPAINNLLNNDEKKKQFNITADYHFGGYAKYTTELIRFMNEFYAVTGVPSDFVYTGKLFFVVTDLIKKDFFASGEHLLIIHTGGLQGNESLPKGLLIF